MEFLLSKLLPLWLYPLGLAILVLLLVALVLLLRGPRRSGLVVLLVTAGLWAAATPRIAARLAATLERDYPERPAAELPEAGAIVVLGGALEPAFPPRRYADLDAAADRVQHALRLYRANRAPRIVASGGVWPWLDAPRSEAEEIVALLHAWRVPRERLLAEGESTNTRENAVNVRQLLEEEEIDDVLLVTSALHMRRALAAFRAAGVEAVPAATDVQAVDTGEPTVLDWMPDARYLYLTQRVLKEYLGWYYYRWKGWV